jgi:crotonobetainyl-CoA:carnitine CoA-transferase CaiB-like acyl-CoA transferase
VATRDGNIVLSAYVEDHWKRLCRALGREELVHDPRFSTNDHRVAHRAELRQVLGECLSAYTSDAAVEMLSQHQIVAGAVRPYRDVLTNADVIATGIFVDAASSDGGRYRALGLPYRMGTGRRPAPTAAPECGADSADLLAELGYSAHDIATLRESGVVA